MRCFQFIDWMTNFINLSTSISTPDILNVSLLKDMKVKYINITKKKNVVII